MLLITVRFRTANLQRSGDCFRKDLTIRLWQHVKTIVRRRMLLKKTEIESMFSHPHGAVDCVPKNLFWSFPSFSASPLQAKASLFFIPVRITASSEFMVSCRAINYYFI